METNHSIPLRNWRRDPMKYSNISTTYFVTSVDDFYQHPDIKMGARVNRDYNKIYVDIPRCRHLDADLIELYRAFNFLSYGLDKEIV